MKKVTAVRIPTTFFPLRQGAPLGLAMRSVASLVVALATGSVLVACGSEVIDASSGGSSEGSATGAGSASTSTGTMGPMWPKRITLLSSFAADQSAGLQLSDGVIVAGEGDLSLATSKVLSVRSPTTDSVCEKGKFEALGDVPAEVDSCPGALSGTWEKFAYLSATTLHTTEESYVIGLGLLLRNKEHTALYRARVVGDSYDAQGMATATFDYEPVP